MSEYEWGRDRETGEQRIRSGLRAHSGEPDMELELKNHETVTRAEAGTPTD